MHGTPLDETPDFLDATHPQATLAAVSELMPLLYEELRRTARRERRRIGAGQTYATTALVNELYVKMHRSSDSGQGFATRADFLAVSAIAMRRILLEQARSRMRIKRGGGQADVELDEDLLPATVADEQLVAVNEALQDLAKQSPRMARIVECRFFAGYSDKETAEALGTSERTVQREWALARAWLQRALDNA